jgi:hypothetical protein
MSVTAHNAITSTHMILLRICSWKLVTNSLRAQGRVPDQSYGVWKSPAPNFLILSLLARLRYQDFVIDNECRRNRQGANKLPRVGIPWRLKNLFPRSSLYDSPFVENRHPMAKRAY